VQRAREMRLLSAGRTV